MHAAPTVEYPVAVSRRARRWLVIGWIAAGAFFCAAMAAGTASAWGWLQAGAVTVALVAAGVAAMQAAHAVGARGMLRWDGLCWWWSSDGPPCEGWLWRGLDLQRAVLVRFQSERGPRRWLWLSAAEAPHAWDALRRALVAHGGRPVPEARGEALP